MPIIADQLIDKILREYGVTALTPLVRTGIQRYISLLLRWNQKISLTTITDPIDIVRLHFAESMFAGSAVPIPNGRLADVGTGAGFPGLPLKLLIPSLNLVLVEPTAKKASFLAECVRELNLTDVEVLRTRFEDLETTGPHFDFITARALGDYAELVEWAERQLAPRGSLVLWLGERYADEIKMASSLEWRSPIPIPHSERRVLLVGTR